MSCWCRGQRSEWVDLLETIERQQELKPTSKHGKMAFLIATCHFIRYSVCLIKWSLGLIWTLYLGILWYGTSQKHSHCRCGMWAAMIAGGKIEPSKLFPPVWQDDVGFARIFWVPKEHHTSPFTKVKVKLTSLNERVNVSVPCTDQTNTQQGQIYGKITH